MELYVKNMVCARCTMAVQNVLDTLRIPYRQVSLGVVTLDHEPGAVSLQQFKENITALGFELIEDRTARIISSIKNAAIEFVRSRDPKTRKLKFSAYVADILNKDYSTLSSTFSSVEGITIEQYLILQKIERVKELLVYDELTLSQIADELGYSSVQHLSNQFKKTTGLTPSHFRSIGENRRVALDKVM